jgi:hypothetical protein
MPEAMLRFVVKRLSAAMHYAGFARVCRREFTQNGRSWGLLDAIFCRCIVVYPHLSTYYLLVPILSRRRLALLPICLQCHPDLISS